MGEIGMLPTSWEQVLTELRQHIVDILIQVPAAPTSVLHVATKADYPGKVNYFVEPTIVLDYLCSDNAITVIRSQTWISN